MMEDKIKTKVENLLLWTERVDMKGETAQKKFAEMMFQSMNKIVKAEVNIRVQDIRHKKKGGEN